MATTNNAERPFIARIEKARDTSQWFDRYRYLDPDNESEKIFSLKQEQGLAQIIADGIAAIEALDAQPDMLDEQRATLEQAAEQALHARHALFEVNLPFAKYMARESTGIIHKESRKKLAKVTFQRLNGKAPGTYKPLSSMKSPYASLEDRSQVAMLAMWKATEKYKPESKAKFATYAAWRIQNAMDHNIYEEEHNGLPFIVSDNEKINAYYREHPSGDSQPMPREISRLVNMSDYTPFPDELFTRSEGGIRELNDPWEDDDIPDELAEIVAYDTPPAFADLISERLDEEVNAMLDLIGERSAEIIRLRWGIGYDRASNYDEIGDIFGVTRERIRQIESKAMAQLRHPSRSKHLRDFMLDNEALSNSVQRGDQICLPSEAATHYSGRVIAKHAPVLREEAPIKSNAALESWQLYQDENWSSAVRRSPEGLNSVPFELLKQVTHTLDTAQVWHFDERVASQSNKPYSIPLMERLEKQLDGKKLSYRQLEQMWNVFMHSGMMRLQDELQWNVSYQRVGRMFSKIMEDLTEHPRDFNDVLELEINPDLRHKIPYLASGLTKGNIRIIGDVGGYVGAYNSGLSSVEVVGDAGMYAGEAMRGYSQLLVRGAVADGVGNRKSATASVRYYATAFTKQR